MVRLDEWHVVLDGPASLREGEVAVLAAAVAGALETWVNRTSVALLPAGVSLRVEGGS